MQVVNPASYGGYGPATKKYIARHPPATTLIQGGQRAGTPLFGTMDPAGSEELANVGKSLPKGSAAPSLYGSMRTALGGDMQAVHPVLEMPSQRK